MSIPQLPIVILLGALLLPEGAHAQKSTTNRFARQADLVVVATVVSLDAHVTGASIHLQVKRILMGSLNGGSTLVAEAGDGSQAAESDSSNCGIWYLKRGNEKLSVIPVAQGPPAASLRTWLASCATPRLYPYAAQSGADDKILSEIAESAELSQGKYLQATHLYRALEGSGSPVEAQVIKRLASSEIPELRAVAFGLQIRNGDVAGLSHAEAEIPGLGSSEAKALYAITISDFPAPEGVPILGRLATGATKAELPFQRAAASALKAIHNPVALNFLYVLLDHPDKEVRENAVSGFSQFRLGMPAGLKGVDFDHALIAATYPGRKTSSAEDREAIHLGRFASAEEEAALINFYKSWWPKNSGRF